MDWLAGSRMHVVEIVCLRGFTIIPMYALGFEEWALKAYILYIYLHSTFIHANVRFEFGWLKHIIATPQFHHWHHGIEKEAIDVNFAAAFPWLDRLFGTHHLPDAGRAATASAAIRCRAATSSSSPTVPPPLNLLDRLGSIVLTRPMHERR